MIILKITLGVGLIVITSYKELENYQWSSYKDYVNKIVKHVGIIYHDLVSIGKDIKDLFYRMPNIKERLTK